MRITRPVWLTIGVSLLITGWAAAWFLRSSPGPANPLAARDLIQSVVPGSWQVVPANEELTETTKEYFPDARVQTLALVGPQIDHLRWRDHQGYEHFEDWSKECLLLWMVPSDFKPRFPNFLDHLANGANLPDRIFSSEHVCVYGYVTNSGFDINRFRKMDKEIAQFTVEGVEPTWTRWRQDIVSKLARSGDHRSRQ